MQVKKGRLWSQGLWGVEVGGLRREGGREERWIRRQVVEEQSWRVEGVEVREGS